MAVLDRFRDSDPHDNVLGDNVFGGRARTLRRRPLLSSRNIQANTVFEDESFWCTVETDQYRAIDSGLSRLCFPHRCLDTLDDPIDVASRSIPDLCRDPHVTVAVGDHVVTAGASDGTPMVRSDPFQVLSAQQIWTVTIAPIGTELFLIPPDRGGISTTSSGTAETVRVGYGRIHPDVGSATPSGLAIFQFSRNLTIYWKRKIHIHLT